MKILHLLEKDNCKRFFKKKLKIKVYLMIILTKKIYPSGSKPATIYGLPKNL